MPTELYQTLTKRCMDSLLDPSVRSNSSAPTRRLSLEDRQWVLDLPDHRGYRLVRARMEELLAFYQQEVLQAEAPAVYRLQGKLALLSEILGLPRSMAAQKTTGEIV